MSTQPNPFTQRDYSEAKRRSYDERPAVGRRVTFTAMSATRCHPSGARLIIGAQYSGAVTSTTNAGFRGIEMSVALVDSGDTVHGISTGSIVRPTQ
jgi:hypothetical protein